MPDNPENMKLSEVQIMKADPPPPAAPAPAPTPHDAAEKIEKKAEPEKWVAFVDSFDW